MTYECHITVSVKDAIKAEKIAATWGWKTSEIARDPLLGDSTYFYLTAHADSYIGLYVLMQSTANELEKASVTVIRKKIEHIVYDTKTGVGT